MSWRGALWGWLADKGYLIALGAVGVLALAFFTVTRRRLGVFDSLLANRRQLGAARDQARDEEEKKIRETNALAFERIRKVHDDEVTQIQAVYEREQREKKAADAEIAQRYRHAGTDETRARTHLDTLIDGSGPSER